MLACLLVCTKIGKMLWTVSAVKAQGLLAAMFLYGCLVFPTLFLLRTKTFSHPWQTRKCINREGPSLKYHFIFFHAYDMRLWWNGSISVGQMRSSSRSVMRARNNWRFLLDFPYFRFLIFLIGDILELLARGASSVEGVSSDLQKMFGSSSRLIPVFSSIRLA